MILDLLFSEPAIFLIYVAAIIVPIALHEFSHAFAATVQGDSTPRDMGRLTFNPLAHIDPMGILLLLIAGFGWGKPTPFNPLNLRNPRLGTVWVALAGPLSNLVQIVIFAIFLKLVAFLGPNNYLVIFLVALVQINIILMLFNLIPIPPLDGSKVLFGFLPASTLEFQARLERTGPLILLGLIILDQFAGIGIFSWIFSGITEAIFSLI